MKSRPIFESANSQHIKREREKARKLKTSSWWKRKLDQGLCYLCGKKFSKIHLTMEHLVPLARGGYSIKNNLETACKTCNSKKTYETIIEQRLKKLNSK